MAVLDLEGRFREINPAFSKLVGYQEHEFRRVVWPSVHDRGVYKQQLEQTGKAPQVTPPRWKIADVVKRGVMDVKSPLR